MSYQREEFIEYMYNKGNVQPGGYCNGLDNVERLFSVDIDSEFEKDQCDSLYKRIQLTRKNPEQIGKNEHTVRQYASNIKRYVEFMKDTKNNSDLKIVERNYFRSIKKIVDEYKKDFSTINRQERYKWEAIKHYKDNWDIDAVDFPEMLERAFSKTFNLLASGQYFPLKMLIEVSKEHPEEVRRLFKMLFDESLPLAKRFDDFRFGFDAFVKKQKLNHYQDLHAISIYLTFEYPEKYYIYKYGVWTGFLKNLEEAIPSVKGKHETYKIECSNELCDDILSLVIKDSRLCSMSQSRLDNKCYKDPNFRMLAFDIMFYGSNCKDDNDSEIDLSDVSPYYTTKNESTEFKPYTKADFLNDVYVTEEKYDTCVSRLKHKKNLILQGAPGVGKTFTARRLAWSVMGIKDNNRIKFVQFHQSYSYEDFIMGYKPDENGFKLENGIFYDFCNKAKDDPYNDYFFIIDEVNRGNLSKIFGELLMLIENDYRGEELILAYNKKPFSVPDNLYIIGMMNTADRSLAMIDYALRRRFSFIEMSPGFDSNGFITYQSNVNNKKFDKLVGRIKALNSDIENDASLGKGFCIGHSYFCNLDMNCEDNMLKEIVDYDIIPMLEEYWFDNDAKANSWSNDLRGVFND